MSLQTSTQTNSLYYYPNTMYTCMIWTTCLDNLSYMVDQTMLKFWQVGWCTLGCTTFLVPLHSSCTIHRIRKYISKEWSFNLGQNNLLMIGVNHFSQMVNMSIYIIVTHVAKKNWRQKTLHVPGLKCTFFGNFLVLHYRFEAEKNILKRILCPSTHTYFFYFILYVYHAHKKLKTFF
jgi:hypothetical protein